MIYELKMLLTALTGCGIGIAKGNEGRKREFEHLWFLGDIFLSIMITTIHVSEGCTGCLGDVTAHTEECAILSTELQVQSRI